MSFPGMREIGAGIVALGLLAGCGRAGALDDSAQAALASARAISEAAREEARSTAAELSELDDRLGAVVSRLDRVKKARAVATQNLRALKARVRASLASLRDSLAAVRAEAAGASSAAAGASSEVENALRALAVLEQRLNYHLRNH